jgi:hypothetical protein
MGHKVHATGDQYDKEYHEITPVAAPTKSPQPLKNAPIVIEEDFDDTVSEGSVVYDGPSRFAVAIDGDHTLPEMPPQQSSLCGPESSYTGTKDALDNVEQVWGVIGVKKKADFHDYQTLGNAIVTLSTRFGGLLSERIELIRWAENVERRLLKIENGCRIRNSVLGASDKACVKDLEQDNASLWLARQEMIKKKNQMRDELRRSTRSLTSSRQRTRFLKRRLNATESRLALLKQRLRAKATAGAASNN